MCPNLIKNLKKSNQIKRSMTHHLSLSPKENMLSKVLNLNITKKTRNSKKTKTSMDTQSQQEHTNTSLNIIIINKETKISTNRKNITNLITN